MNDPAPPDSEPTGAPPDAASPDAEPSPDTGAPPGSASPDAEPPHRQALRRGEGPHHAQGARHRVGQHHEAPPPPTHGGTARARKRLGEDAPEFVEYFKERVYATFTGLAIILVVSANDAHDAAHAVLALLLGVVGITAAGFVSGVISHLAVHRDFPGGAELRAQLRIAGGALGTLVTPMILLALAWFGVLPLPAALRAAEIVYVATLAVIGWFAVRRSRLDLWKQLLALTILVTLGLVVVLLQTLAHSV